MIERWTYAPAPEAVSDLRRRLHATRWPDWLPGAGWSMGAEETFLRDFIAYWASQFDFDAHVERINAFPQFRAEIDGERIAFYHLPSGRSGARPLLLLHGWPGSVAEFLDAIPLLAADGAFDLVVPSLPGFGLSGPTRTEGVNHLRMAGMMVRLMETLGYPRFFVQGGDWGGIVAATMGQHFAGNVAALHLNLAPAGPGDPTQTMEGLSAEDAAAFARYQQFMAVDQAYAHVQATRPQSLAVGLSDSPAGFAAWVIDRFYAWTDHEGDLGGAFSRQRLVDNLCLHWFGESIASGFRMYHESLFRFPYTNPEVSVPTGVARFPAEPMQLPRAIVERMFHDVREWREFPRGGHFPAMQLPHVFAGAVRDFLVSQDI